MPVPERVPMSHYRGDTLAFMLRLWDDTAKTVPSDLTGSTVLAQVRSVPDSEEIIATFTTDVDANEITLTLLPAVTELLPEDAAYDVQIDWQSDGANIQTIVAGPLTAPPDVSRD